MAKLRINGDSSGYVDLEAPNAASSSTLDLDQVPQKNATTKFDTVLQVGSSSTITNAYGAPYGYVFDVKANSGTQSYMSIGTPSDTLGSGGLVMGLDTSAVRITSRDDKRQIFSTNDIDRMTIHSTTSGGGAVTTPYQPSFLAIAASGGTLSAGVHTFAGASAYNAHIFTNIAHNIGSHYNSSNSRFTAPVTGLYQFYGSMATDSGQSATAYLSFEFYINGTRHRTGWDNHAVGYQKTSTVKTAYLNAGDYVYPGYEAAQIFTLLGGSLTAQYVHFGGHLIG